MLTNNFRQIFVYNHNPQTPLPLEQFSTLPDLHTFQTDNLYRLKQYAREVNPNLLLFNITDAAALADLKNLLQSQPVTYPIIVLAPSTIRLQPLPNVAHYLHLPEDRTKLHDIIASYYWGNRHHDILYISNYRDTPSAVSRQLQATAYTFFEVHQADAARLYLSKNTPQIICIEYAPQFITLRHSLKHQRIFYVDRQQDITEIKNFLR